MCPTRAAPGLYIIELISADADAALNAEGEARPAGRARKREDGASSSKSEVWSVCAGEVEPRATVKMKDSPKAATTVYAP